MALVSVSVNVDAEDEREEHWTRVEARKKVSVWLQDGLAEMVEAVAADVMMSDAGINKWVSFIFSLVVLHLICVHFTFSRSALEPQEVSMTTGNLSH